MSSSSASMRARAGGVNLRNGPSSSISASRSRKYCGHASAATRAPADRSRSISATTAGELQCATPTAAPAWRLNTPTTATATSSAVRLRHSEMTRGSSRPSACRRASAAIVSASSSQCTSEIAPSRAKRPNHSRSEDAS